MHITHNSKYTLAEHQIIIVYSCTVSDYTFLPITQQVALRIINEVIINKVTHEFALIRMLPLRVDNPPSKVT